MANRAGNTATSIEVIPAGHAALTAKEELGENAPDRSTGFATLSLAALGVVFGDIGTSPVYTFRECFNPEHGLPLDAEHVLGVLSMIFWALIIVVTVKYVLLIMRADKSRRGWNSCFAGPRLGAGPRRALPQSLGVARPRRRRAVLWRQHDHAGNFRAQRGRRHWRCDAGVEPFRAAGDDYCAARAWKGGTGRVGRIFGPVMILWFAVIAMIGVLHIAEAPRVLGALNPAHAAHIFVATPGAGFVVLGAVALAITGGEAL
jgi:KUP system potassium uptake protein